MDNNIIHHEGQLKSSDHQMEMMMMTAMLQIPNGHPSNYNIDHHHYMDSLSSTVAQPFSLHHQEQQQQQLLSPPPPPPHFLSAPTAGGGGGFGKRNVNGSTSTSSMAAMREMIFRMAVMQPVHIDPESVKPPKRRNVRISKDPQSVAARHRRERISERIRILQRLVPGGTKMDTASMLDEAIHYVKFLKTQVQSLERVSAANNGGGSARSCSATGVGFPVAMSTGTYVSPHHHHHINKGFSNGHFGDVFD